MLPKVFKRKLHIVVSGKTLFKQQRGDVGAFFVILIMATIIGGSYWLVNGVPMRFFVQDPLDADNATTYSLNEKKIAKGKKNALQLKDIPFVPNTPTPEPESREPNEPRDRPDDRTTRPGRPTRRPSDRNGDNETVITRGPQPPGESEPPSTTTGCGIAHPQLKTGKRPDGSCCVEDGPVQSLRECCPGVPSCRQVNEGNSGQNISGGCDIDDPGLDQDHWCNAKPIIYLYPTKPTVVNIRVKASGPIVISDPLYPADGWKNVLAHPDGKFVYKGSEYKELFYEAAIPPATPPKSGIIVKTSELRKTLLMLVTKLGLRGFEQEEFVSFWTEKLEKENTPYVLVSIFPQEVKETFDHVIISPTPDTFIQFIAYFKPLSYAYPIAPLALPKEPPQRVGFTAVEWGGILDN